MPPVIRGDEIRIPIVEAEQQILPGRKTKLWTFGGSFPGPTVRRPAGHRTRVTFEHEMPEKVGDLTVHLHGGHNRSQFDGYPGGLTKNQPISFYCDISPRISAKESGNDLLLSPGGEKTYVYDLTEDGRPERAAFQWYHDHRLDRTALHAWHGLAGMWIVDDAFEEALPLPRGEADLPLMIADRSFDDRNQLTDPFADQLRPPADGIRGEKILVNGAFMPHHQVAARRYRLRILNISSFRSYDVFLGGRLQMIQIATESGLMPKPIRRDSVLLGPAERAEVVVDFSQARGETVELRSSRHHAGPDPDGARTYEGALMQFRVGSERVRDRAKVPRQLRPLPGWASGVKPRKPDKLWEITIGGGFKTKWLLNGRTFDPTHIEATARLNTTEVWEIHNRTSVAHVMHIHHTDWYLLQRDGKPPPPWENCLKETFFVYPNEKILLAGRFADYTGKFVIHCHMLDHEDHGLMGQFRVVRA